MKPQVAHKRRNSRAARARTGAVPPNNRSRVTNGSRVMIGIDLRSREGRRWRDLFHAYTAETGGAASETLCKQLATLVMQRERMDAAVARGEAVNVFDLVRIAGAINRTMTRLGLDEPEPYDGTQDAIRALREGRPQEART